MALGPVVHDIAPNSFIAGTGQNQAAEFITAFAKGLADKALKEKETQAANQRAMLQAMVQQEMISPAGQGSKPDMTFGGIPLKIDPQAQSGKKTWEMLNLQSQVADRSLEAAMKTDPGAWVEKELNDFDQKYRAATVWMSSRPDYEEKTQALMAQKRKELTEAASRIGYLQKPQAQTPAPSSSVLPAFAQQVQAPTSATPPSTPWGGSSGSNQINAATQTGQQPQITPDQVKGRIAQLRSKKYSDAQIASFLRRFGIEPKDYGVNG